MNSEATISVVIPAYNAAACIEAALRSVAEQGVDGIAVIVVDDASTDQTIEVVQHISSDSDFRLHISDVTLLTQSTNSGPAAARNRGISEAKGEWIAFLDADDLWLPGKLEAQLALAEERKDVCLCCTGTVAQHSGDGFSELTLKDLVTDNPIVTSSVMVRREALNRVGGFDERFSGAEDYDLWLRLLGAGNCRATKINRQFVVYRSEAGSLSMDDRRFLPEALKVLEKAFANDGALAGFSNEKNLALANQYWNASWMAFNRGSRGDAMQLLCKAWRLMNADRTTEDTETQREMRKRPWCRLFLRYLLGSKAG